MDWRARCGRRSGATRDWNAALAALLLLAAGAARAQTLLHPPFKVLELRETNAALEELQYFPMLGIEGDTYHARMTLGDGMNLFGSQTYAEAYVNDGGTFWGAVEADNNNPLYHDWGHGEATTWLHYSMHKEEGPADVTLHVTGGLLAVGDYGGGTEPLEAFVILDVYVVPELPVEPYHVNYFAALSGRGGTPDTESFDWGAEGLDVTEANYHEDGYIGNVNTADLEIPAQTHPFILDQMCSVCDFRYSVRLTVVARNPGAETYAYAYFRDPVEFGSDDVTLGAASISYSGVTLLPSPEPEAAAGQAVALAAALSLCRARRRASRPRRTTPRATAPAA
jgi:hypothetical protein